MTTVERTAYPRFKRALTEQELTAVYTLSDEERRFINGMATTPQMQLNLALLLKSCQRLAYFLNLTRVPSRIVTYLRQLRVVSSSRNPAMKFFLLGLSLILVNL